MSTEMRRNESKQKLYILSRHATTVICCEYASISWDLITMSFYAIIIIGNWASGAKRQV